MNSITCAGLLKLLNDGQVVIPDVGAFWSQVTCVHMPGISAPILSIPMTLHLSGDMGEIVYVQILCGPGLKQMRRRAGLNFSWNRRRGFRAKTLIAVSSFAIPEQGMYWQGETQDKDARRLGEEFAIVLSDEYPDPVAEVLRYFETDLDTLVRLLLETDYQKAGNTLQSIPGIHQ